MITATHKGKYYDVEYSIVNVSELEGKLRIDAEYYEPKYIEILSKIHFKNNDLFWKFIIKFEAGKNLSQYKTGIPYIRTQNVRQIMIEKEGLSYVKTDKNKLKMLKKGDILFVRVGVGVGDCSVVNEEFENTTFSDNVIKIRLKEVNPFFITVFLNTKIGKEYFSHVFKGTARPLISKENFQNLKIPIPSDTFQKFIEKLVLKAYEERQKAEQFYKQAEEILLEKLGLKNWKPKTKKINIGGQEFEEEENISIRMLSDVIKADRMDAEYWELKYDELEEMIKSFEYEKLYRLASDSYEIFNPKTCDYFYYLEIANVDLVTGNYELKKLPCASAPSRAKKIVDEKDILISTVRPNRNAVAFVIRKDKDPFVASTGFCKLKVMDDRILPEYLFVLFKTDLYRELLIRKTTATMYPAVSENDIMQLDIPILPMDIQEHIRDLVMIGFQSRENSKKLLEIAKKTVEIYIEKDEEEGLNYARNKLNELNIEIN